ncbi:unnamed protein product [Porites lobata]|uniref:Uncharacterized protein n=1 Tax=Porites lobata TaxID=104759 RepID=A0ABN8NBN5_9CNID|nr:unnamed protein product [Porites lobata]
MFVVHIFKRTLQWLVHSRLSPQFSGNGVQLFLSPDEAGSIIENRDAGPVSWDLLKTDIQCGSSMSGNLDCLRRRLLWRWKTRLSPVNGEKPKNVAEDIEDKLIFPQTIFRIFASLCSPQFLLGKKGLQLTACRCSRCYRIPD